MRKIAIFLFILISTSFSQVGFVEVNHPIYNYLERMNSLHIILDYNSFETPKSRKDIVKFIKNILIKKDELNLIDQKTLEDFEIEFEFDLFNSTNNYYSQFEDTTDTAFFNQKEKFIYFYSDSSTFNTFVKFVGTGEQLFSIDKLNSENTKSSLITFGAEIRGTISNNFGYFAKATNGMQFGDVELALFNSNLKYNYKYNSDHDSSKYFDETIGYFMAEFDNAKFKIGRDRVNLGYGFSKTLIDNFAPPMDYISLQLNYSIFSFSFLHGKLFGSTSYLPNSVAGVQRVVADKYIAYHRLGLNISRHFQFGIGEAIIYANRNLDFSYLNPFNFYKSAEHANQDRDNSLMFFDFKNNSVTGLMFYGIFLIDDVDFVKLGTKWYGNKFLYDFGITYEPFPEHFPLTIGMQYLRINPYVYAHRFADNNYTSMNFGIGTNIQPNSETLIFDIKYKPNYRIELEFSFQHTKHGANEIDENGNVITNYGGDILVGHRIEDSDNVTFLDGILEISNNFIFVAKYEPIKNYLFSLKTNIMNTKMENETTFNQIISSLILSVRI